MKVDLHVHSKFSKNPNEWILRKLGARESYTEPEDIYKFAKKRGMDAVTITDHNTIGGCLAIQHLPDTFISCEYTAYFPTDRCKVHVLCFNITPEQHDRINAIRSDIFKMAAYLKQEKIVHSVAHPFFSPDSRLTRDHFSQLLDLFDTFERNGAKDFRVNEYLRKLLEAVMPAHKLTGGSDDHSMLTIARMWTEVPGAKSIPEFMEAVSQGRCMAKGEGATPHTLAWNIYSIGWQWLKDSKAANGSCNTLDSYLLPTEKYKRSSLVKRIWLNTTSFSPKKLGVTIPLNYVNKVLGAVDTSSLQGLPMDKQWFLVLDSVMNKYLNEFGNRIIQEFAEKTLLGVFSNIGANIGLHALLTPFFVAFGNLAAQRRLALDVLESYKLLDRRPMKVAKFTDTFGTVDGVSRTLEEQLRQARKEGKDYTIISCVGEEDQPGLKCFSPVGMLAAPEFEQQKLCWPPLLKILDYCDEQDFTHIQAATPGPVGLAGMIVAKTLALPFHAVYHTQVPEFIGKVTGDLFLEELAWKYCLWFYDSADTIFGPSAHTKLDLVNHGINPDKIKIYPRGVNTELFNPDKRTDYWESKWGVDPQTIKALYVGRVSKEKNLPLLVNAFKKLATRLQKENGTPNCPPITLLVVGDGGYWDEMNAECNGHPVVFTKELHGEELAQAFASADFLVFPSTTDTYGRVVLEGLASGIPCIVTDVGGPKENVVEGVSGLVIPADNEGALVAAIEHMAMSADREQMGRKAREFSETRSFAEAFGKYWRLYAA